MKPEKIKDLERISVFQADELAGTITRTENGSKFEYDPKYRQSKLLENEIGIAFRIPPSMESKSTRGDNLHPFFAGLLPEGRRLNALISSLKTSADDMFSLLAAVGADCIGDVKIRLEPETKSLQKAIDILDFDQISFDELFEKSITAAEFISLPTNTAFAGVQPKLSAEMISFPVSLKKRNRRYILKLAPDKFPRLVENEHFFMKLARACGLTVANTRIVQDKNGESGLLVERFDRVFDDKSDTLFPLHQEDACQFLDRYPQDKYRLQIGEIAKGIEGLASAPIIEIGKLIELYAFSYLIANGDLHGKNISLLYDSRSRKTRLSPAYDLVSTLPYGDSSMALNFAGRNDSFRARDFVEFGKSFGVREKATLTIIENLTTTIEAHLEEIGSIGLSSKQEAHLKRTVRKRVKSCSP